MNLYDVWSLLNNTEKGQDELGSRSRYLNSSNTDILHWVILCHGSEVKVSQSCPNLCDPMDFTAHGILQARILEWVAFSFSRESSQPRDLIQLRSPTLWADSLLTEPQGKSFVMERREYMHCRPFTGVSDLYLLDASSSSPHPHNSLQLWQPHMCPDIDKCILGGKSDHFWRSLV